MAFITCTSNYANDVAAIKNDPSKILIWWRVIIDPDGTPIDVTNRISDNTVSGGFSGEFSSWEIVFKNDDDYFGVGDFADSCVQISARVGIANGFITLFTGYVSSKGIGISRGLSTRTKKATMQLVGRNKTKGMKRKPKSTLLTNFEISNTSDTTSSVIHHLAGLLGIEATDVIVGDIELQKDFIKLGDNTAWEELKKIREQYNAFMYFDNNDKLVFETLFETGYVAPTSEWDFNYTNIHNSIIVEYSDVQCNSAKTSFDDYVDLGARTIYMNVDDYNAYTKQIAILVGPGEYFPGPTTDDIFEVSYKDPISGEDFPICTDVSAPTIGLTGSGSDVECDGGVLLLYSFNGAVGTDPSKTRNAPDKSQFIFYNSTGSAITITKLTIRGNAWRLRADILVEYTDAAVIDEIDTVAKEIDGKYSVNAEQAHLSLLNIVEYEKVKRKNLTIKTNFLPMVQPFAVVNVTIPGDATGSDYRVLSYRHYSRGPFTKIVTELTLRELETNTSGGSPRTTTTTTADPTTASGDTEIIELDDRPTYDDIDNGYDSDDGTTTPLAPTISISAFTKAIKLEWDKQTDLRWLLRYEVMVREYGDSIWRYPLSSSTTFYDGSVTAESYTTNEYFLHCNIPLGSPPESLRLEYRVRQVTVGGNFSDWSNVVDAVIYPVMNDDMYNDVVTAEKLSAAARATAEEGLEALYSFDDGIGCDDVDLMSWFKFEANAEDSGIARNPLIINNNVVITQDGATFNGTNSYLRYDGFYFENLYQQTISISCTLYKDATQIQRILYFPDTTGNNRLYLSISTAGVISVSMGDGTMHTIWANPLWSDGDKFTFTILRDAVNKTLTVYVNGFVVVDGISATITSASSSDVSFGANYGGGEYMTGTIHWVKIYDRLLSSAEAYAEYESNGQTTFPRSEPAWEYYFADNSDGWTVDNIIKTDYPHSIRTVSTTDDPQIYLTTDSLYIDGSRNRYVYVRVRTASTLIAVCFYKTDSHSFSALYYKQGSVVANNGVWQTIQFDMHTLTAGGVDWKNNVITNIRLDLTNASGVTVDVAWVKIGDQYVEGIIKDNAGAQQNGQIVGHPAFRKGKAGKAIYFADNAYVIISEHTLDMDLYWTINVWVKGDGTVQTNTYPCVLESGGFLFYASGTTGDGAIYFVGPGGSVTYTIDDLFDDKWHMVTLINSFISNSLDVYVDGSYHGEFVYSGAGNIVLSNTIYIGNNISLEREYIGEVDEFRIFNQALTLAQIRSYYENPNGVTPSMLTADRFVAHSIDTVHLNAGTFTGILAKIAKVIADQVDAMQVSAVTAFIKSIVTNNLLVAPDELLDAISDLEDYADGVGGDTLNDIAAGYGYASYSAFLTALGSRTIFDSSTGYLHINVIDVATLVASTAFITSAKVRHLLAADGQFGGMTYNVLFEGEQTYASGTTATTIISWLASIGTAVNKWYKCNGTYNSHELVSVCRTASALDIQYNDSGVQTYTATTTISSDLNFIIIWDVGKIGSQLDLYGDVTGYKTIRAHAIGVGLGAKRFYESGSSIRTTSSLYATGYKLTTQHLSYAVTTSGSLFNIVNNILQYSDSESYYLASGVCIAEAGTSAQYYDGSWHDIGGDAECMITSIYKSSTVYYVYVALLNAGNKVARLILTSESSTPVARQIQLFF